MIRKAAMKQAAAIDKNVFVILISKTQVEAKLAFDEYVKLLADDPNEKHIRISQNKLQINENQSAISINVDRIDSIRGYRADIIILDDISYLKDHQNIIYSVLGEAGVIML